MLPVRVRPYPAETVTSYFHRLSTANHLPERALWREVRNEYPEAPQAVAPRSAAHVVCQLGGLPEWYLPDSIPDRRCTHDPTVWVRRCPNCRSGYGSVTMCRRCTGGDLVIVAQQVGPICVKHQRWHAGGLDIDVSNLPAQVSAQRRLNGALRMKFISHITPEAAIARDLIHGWIDAPPRQDGEVDHASEIASLPALVDLLVLLSSAEMISILQDAEIRSQILMRLLRCIAQGADAGITVLGAVRQLIANAHGDPSFASACETLRTVPADKTLPRPKRSVAPIREALLSHTGRADRHKDPLWAMHEPAVRRRRQLDWTRAEIQRLQAQRAELERLGASRRAQPVRGEKTTAPEPQSVRL